MSKDYYTYGVEHTPDFEAWSYVGTNSIIQGLFDLADVIYDYKLSIDESKMTKVKIDEYGLKISADKHAFIAEKAQAVNNEISLIIDYILINGQKGQLKVDYTIVEKDITFEEKNVTLGSNVFEAKLTDADSQVLSVLNKKYVYAKTVDFVPEDVFGSDYNEWEDAMYEGLQGCATTDDKVNFLKNNMDIIGGDPINVDAAYNNALKDNFIYIDYVDADGKSCIYGVNSADALTKLKSIKKLRVYFIAGTYVNGIIHNDNDYAVKLPYYTVSGDKWRLDQGFALPLDNAFRVRVATAKNEQTVASYTFTFELTMPECPVTRVKSTTADKSVLWSKLKDSDNKEWELLKVYGEKNANENKIMGDLRDAFTGIFNISGTKYEVTPEASYYTLTTAAVDANEQLIGGANGNSVTLAGISTVSEWSEWNTWDDSFVDNHFTANDEGYDMLADNIVYNHFGVYPENLDKFYVQFASKIEDSQKPTYNTVSGQTGNGEEKTPLMAQTVYKMIK